ncbi:MerR family transcriptional regulator [Lacticigenium naphthae]|uniref:MerR family transcriptional regulator n=1 Tax=Lacticigenium naphthae TaxID=515351 RepID=UPI000410BE89|nr:MerR family transcriptional regulator [Lacticigenium naphthae]
MKGIDVARICDVSTSSLKHYEKWGLVPAVPRAANGYRVYSTIHVYYFQCIVQMNSGFGLTFVRQIMPLIQEGEFLQVLWLVTEEQAHLLTQQKATKKVNDILNEEGLEQLEKQFVQNKLYKIGEVAREVGVASSAIRFWEKEGLIQPKRDGGSGYRLFSKADVRRVLILRTVSQTTGSLEIAKEILLETEHNNLKRMKEIAQQSLDFLDETLIMRMKALSQLNALFDVLAEENDGWSKKNIGHYAYYRENKKE